MADLSEERKRQIRAEEEARALEREEERYREQVRREIEASRASEPEPEPEPGSVSFSIPASPASASASIRASASPAFASPSIRGSTAALGFAPTLRVPAPPVPAFVSAAMPALGRRAAGTDAESSSASAPARRRHAGLWIAGIAVLLAGIAFLVVGGRAEGVPVSDTEAPASSVLAAAVDYLPQDTVAAVGLDLEQVRRSSTIGRLVDVLLARTGQGATISAATSSGGLDVRAAGQALVVAAIPSGSGGNPRPLVIIAGPLDEARVETELLASGGAAGTRDAEGVTIALRDASVLIRKNLLVIAPAAVLDRAIAARAGESAAETGPLRDALLAGHAGTAGFTAVRMIDDLHTALHGFMPDLATAAWFAASLDISGGVTLTGIGAFPDQATAARIATAAETGRAAGAKELREKDPIAARAVEKVVATTGGATTRLTVTLDPAEVDALVAHVR